MSLKSIAEKIGAVIKDSDGFLAKAVGNVNDAVKKIDLSGAKLPTVKTDNSFRFDSPVVIVAVIVAVFFLFKGRR